MTAAALLLRPEALPLLVLVPAAWLLLRRGERARARRREDLLGPRADALSVGANPRGRALRGLLLAGGLLLAVVVLLEPAGGEDATGAAPRGADVAVCLDVSRSMEAGDLPPDRLRRARSAIRALAARSRGDRFALVVFAGDARLVVPLTRDGAAFTAMADAAGPLSTARGGSDPGAALLLAAGALRSGGRGEGAILVLSDGEDHAGGGPAAAERCAELGLPVHVLALGTEAGGKIPAGGRGAGFLRDAGGREVVTRLEPDRLRAIASAAGGSFLDARAGDAAVDDFLERRVLVPARGTAPPEERRRRASLHPWPLLGAFLLWSLAWCAGLRRPS